MAPDPQPGVQDRAASFAGPWGRSVSVAYRANAPNTSPSTSTVSITGEQYNPVLAARTTSAERAIASAVLDRFRSPSVTRASDVLMTGCRFAGPASLPRRPTG